MCDALGKAFANTAAKIILNFGKVVGPVAEEWATIMQYVQVNPMCDQNCAVKCLNPKKRDTMYFDTKCLASCKCQFDISKIKPEKVRMMAKNLEESIDESSDFWDRRITEFKKIVEPRIDYYLKKERELHEDFGDLLEKHAVDTFGCDKRCIDECYRETDEEEFFVNFWELPMCVSNCRCSFNNLINIERKPVSKNINLHHVMRDADKESWALFKKNKDQWLD